MRENSNLPPGVTDYDIEQQAGAFEQQPTRGRVREQRDFDKTQLHEDHHGKYVHRDYAAHFFRWGWVSRQIKQGDCVLDVGCGQDQPLAKVLSGRPGGNREQYVGVDLNRIAKPFKAAWADVRGEFNFIEDHAKLLEDYPGGFDRIVCLEVIEHMTVPWGKKLLDAFQQVIVSGGTLYLSTPVFNGAAAANHIHEYTVPELQAMIEGAGFNVERRVGTFASLPEIKRVLTKEEMVVYDRLSGWFGNDVMSTIFACNYPDASRNNLWVCTPL